MDDDYFSDIGREVAEVVYGKAFWDWKRKQDW